jgi:hypothetical protein
MKRILAIAMALVIFSCNEPVKENESTKQTKNDIIENFTALIESDVKDDNIDGSFSLAIIHKDSTLALKSYGNAEYYFPNWLNFKIICWIFNDATSTRRKARYKRPC